MIDGVRREEEADIVTDKEYTVEMSLQQLDPLGLVIEHPLGMIGCGLKSQPCHTKGIKMVLGAPLADDHIIKSSSKKMN